jgi:hypothetical protein
MVKEFIEGAHLNKFNKYAKDDNYLIYLSYKNQSKAFQVGLFAGISSVFIFYRRVKFSKNYTNFSKFFYAVNLFLVSHVFIYEIWSKVFTNKEIVYGLDKYILKF